MSTYQFFLSFQQSASDQSHSIDESLQHSSKLKLFDVLSRVLLFSFFRETWSIVCRYNHHKVKILMKFNNSVYYQWIFYIYHVCRCKFNAFLSIKMFYSSLVDPEKRYYIIDLYTAMFFCDFVCFMILTFGYSSFGVRTVSFRLMHTSWLWS